MRLSSRFSAADETENRAERGDSTAVTQKRTPVSPRETSAVDPVVRIHAQTECLSPRCEMLVLLCVFTLCSSAGRCEVQSAEVTEESSAHTRHSARRH